LAVLMVDVLLGSTSALAAVSTATKTNGTVLNAAHSEQTATAATFLFTAS
jgi:hypothetical protein